MREFNSEFIDNSPGYFCIHAAAHNNYPISREALLPTSHLSKKKTSANHYTYSIIFSNIPHSSEWKIVDSSYELIQIWWARFFWHLSTVFTSPANGCIHLSKPGRLLKSKFYPDDLRHFDVILNALKLVLNRE